MKTTLEIPDPVFRKAKVAASQLGIPLREFVTQAVESKLRERQANAAKPWMACAGALASFRTETQKIQKRIDEEFGQLEAEDRE